MKIREVIRCCCVLTLVAVLAGWRLTASADEKPRPPLEGKMTDMPVLTGDVWQKMTADERVAFVWGIGHVVTIEQQTAERRPELKREGFADKMAEGLNGVSMNSIVQKVDEYYQANPDDLEAPVMEVIWDELVKPRIKTGIADQPLN